jgi:hypothetical protein
MKVSVAVEIPSHHRILFKPVDNCETDGCRMEVWLPDGVNEASKGAIPIASESQSEMLLSNADKKQSWYMAVDLCLERVVIFPTIKSSITSIITWPSLQWSIDCFLSQYHFELV